MSEIVYMPMSDGRTQPAPYVLTDEEVALICRLECKDVKESLRRYRDKSLLRPIQLGNHLRYLLPDVMKFLANVQEENPR